MKPRLVMYGHLWYCGTPYTRPGLGYTVAHAYADWMGRNNNMRRLHAHKVGA